MTKKIRIENADNGPDKVLVQVWDKGRVLEDGCSEPDVLAFERHLDCPTAMTGDDIYLTSTRYVVVKEA